MWLFYAIINPITNAITNAKVNGLNGLNGLNRLNGLNGLNGLTYIIFHWKDVLSFIMDLIDPIKLAIVVPVNIEDRNNSYNELNIRDGNNINAILSQIFRLIKSVSYIAHKITHNNTEIDVNLDSDFDHLGKPLPATYTTETPPNYKFNEESWLFINGIGGEYHWLKQYCDRVSKRFGRKVQGIFNRGDGLLWDLIECIHQRNFAQDTTSSKQATDEMEKVLMSNLENAKIKKIAMIAYSQGCLVLKLSLIRILNNPNVDKKVLSKKLRVFTFGNPSIDWLYGEEDLSVYSSYTEHFANSEDFVSKLGVIHEDQKNYHGSKIFINENRKGHLFGTQYSLVNTLYNDGQTSQLLAMQPNLALP